MRAIVPVPALRYPTMKKIGVLVCGFIAASMTIVACGDLTGPKSPETPINVTATLASATSVRIDWTKSPQSDGVISYNILRNGTKVGESTTFSFTDTGLAEKTTYKYTVSANCTAGLLSDASPETPAATVTTADVTPPRIVVISPVDGATNISTAATVTATFNEAMDPTTINTTTFSLKITATGANIPGTVTYTAATRVAEFKPTNSFPSATSITATVTAGAKDISGNALLLTAASPGIWSFTTRDDVPPTVLSTVPANGATLVDATAPITVTFSEAMDPTTINGTTITLSATGGSPVAGTVTYNVATHVATFTPSATLSAPVSYTATVTTGVKDLAGNAMVANVVFSFTTRDTTAPFVVSTSPADLATNVATNAVISAIFSKAMDGTTINASTFTLKVAATGVPVAGTVAYSVGSPATFTPTVALASSTTYTATITTGAHDTFGNALAANKVWTFITADVIPPTVQSVSPADGAANVAVNSAVNITFSEAMLASTINGTNITLKTTSSGTPVSGTVTYTAATNTATFTPSGALAFGTNYTVTVTTGVTDLAGNALAIQKTTAFATAAAPDITPPTVVGTVPTPDGVTGVAINAPITATFSEAMDPLTITTSTFTLKTTAGAVPVTGTVSYDAGTKTATFTPSSPLANNTGYTATITNGVKDLAGNNMVANKVITFTTVADTTPPTVLSTSPTDGATGIAVTSVVTVTFSEAMDASTVTAVGTFTLKATVSGNPVTGTVTYDAGTHVATFTPSAPLSPSLNYTATVTSAAKDVAGNPLSPGTVIFKFTTAP